MQLKMLNIFTKEFRVLTGNFEFQIREAFIRKNRKYIGLLPIWGYTPPPFGGLVISGFFLGYFLSFSETRHETDSV